METTVSTTVTGRDLTVDAAGDDWLDEAASTYERYGVVVTRGLPGLDAIRAVRAELSHLIGLRCAAAGIEHRRADDESFDDGFAALCRADRAHGGAVYDAGKRLFTLNRLAVAEHVAALSRRLMATEHVMTWGGIQGVRIDHPGEAQFLFPWHQDFPYIQLSQDGLVYWIPLKDVDERNGALEVIPGSHRAGVLPVRVHEERCTSGALSRSMDIADRSAVADLPRLRMPCCAGDAVVFSMLLVHRSRPSQRDVVRWTAQVRHGNFDFPDAVARGWPAGLIGGRLFHETYPEYVVSGGDQEASP